MRSTGVPPTIKISTVCMITDKGISGSIQRVLELLLTFNSSLTYPASSTQEETSDGQQLRKSRLSPPLEV